MSERERESSPNNSSCMLCKGVLGSHLYHRGLDRMGHRSRTVGTVLSMVEVESFYILSFSLNGEWGWQW